MRHGGERGAAPAESVGEAKQPEPPQAQPPHVGRAETPPLSGEKKCEAADGAAGAAAAQQKPQQKPPAPTKQRPLVLQDEALADAQQKLVDEVCEVTEACDLMSSKVTPMSARWPSTEAT